jgi:hypothetical protein
MIDSDRKPSNSCSAAAAAVPKRATSMATGSPNHSPNQLRR